LSKRPKVYGHLLAEVVRKDLCVGCGTCASVCPVDAIELVGGVPKLVGQCIACGMCYNNCPMTDFDVEEMERRVFGRSRKEEEAEIGVNMGVYAVRTTSEDIHGRSQDGGAVTSILARFLEDGGECAVVAGLEEGKPWAPRPVVALDEGEVVDAAGTKYTPSPTLIGVASAVIEYDKSNIAVVGTPCQIRGLRRVEQGDFYQGKMSKAVYLNVGLFCMETFDYESFMDYLKGVGVDPSKVTKFEIKSGKFIAHQGGEVVHETRLKNVKKLVRPCCTHCDDFASEFADVSVGNVGSPDGWSTVIVRTERGEGALRAAEKAGLVEVKPIDEVKPGMDIVLKLAKMKKKEALKIPE